MNIPTFIKGENSGGLTISETCVVGTGFTKTMT